MTGIQPVVDRLEVKGILGSSRLAARIHGFEAQRKLASGGRRPREPARLHARRRAPGAHAHLWRGEPSREGYSLEQKIIRRFEPCHIRRGITE